MGSILGWLVVNFVLCLISFIAYSAQIFIIWPWYGQEVSIELLALLIPFNILVGMLLWSYFLCVTTDPGQVPESWKPDTHADGYEVKKLTGGPRYCRVCQKYKPPRAHHCRSCEKCVLRMDHHCPWINNCVGHFNYGHFIRFLFYVDVACSYHLAMVTRRVFYAASSKHGFWDEPSSVELVFIILNYVACIPVLLAVGGFSIYHFFGLLGNTTTIEWWEKDKATTMFRRGKIQEVKFPYDLGRRRNIKAVLGESPLLWCCPSIPRGTGLKYELADRDDTKASWPPRDLAIMESDRLDDAAAVLPSSPWTYENDGFNPELLPSNARNRHKASSQRRKKPQNIIPGSSSLPPYHPDYQEGVVSNEPDTDSETSSVGSDWEGPSGTGKIHVRRGSEGYEVRPEGREDMLQRYLQELGEEPGRYIRYIQEPDTDSEDDNVPLAQTLDNRQGIITSN